MAPRRQEQSDSKTLEHIFLTPGNDPDIQKITAATLRPYQTVATLPA